MSKVIFSAILTGADDGLDDLDLEVISFNATLRESTSCYVSLVVNIAQLDAVLLRPSGTIDLYKTIDDGTPALLVSTNQQEPRLDIGGQSRSYRLTGTTTASFTPFDTVDVQPEDVIEDRLLSDGRKSWIVDPALTILPGDTIDYYETVVPDSYTIDIVAIVADGKRSQVTITEASA